MSSLSEFSARKILQNASMSLAMSGRHLPTDHANVTLVFTKTLALDIRAPDQSSLELYCCCFFSISGLVRYLAVAEQSLTYSGTCQTGCCSWLAKTVLPSQSGSNLTKSVIHVACFSLAPIMSYNKEWTMTGKRVLRFSGR